MASLNVTIFYLIFELGSDQTYKEVPNISKTKTGIYSREVLQAYIGQLAQSWSRAHYQGII